jgi:addiction module HigA family antidote
LGVNLACSAPSVDQRSSLSVHVPYQRINELIHQQRGMTPTTALRLAKLFDMSAGFWMNQQLRWDLYPAGVAETLQDDCFRGGMTYGNGTCVATAQLSPPSETGLSFAGSSLPKRSLVSSVPTSVPCLSRRAPGAIRNSSSQSRE